MTTGHLDTILLVAAAILLVAIAAVRLSVGTGLPSLLLYVGLGLLLGQAVFGLRLPDLGLAQQLGYAALVVILAEGGLTTPWERVRSTVPLAAALATVGVAVSVAVTALAAHALLGLDWRGATLAGSLVASTDAAAVFSVLRRVPLPPRLAGILEAESGFNDAPVVLLVVALATPGEAAHPLGLLVGVLAELAIGAVVGLGVGRLGVELVRRIALPAAGLYPIAVTAWAVLAYGAASAVHGSGFLAVYLAGLLLGNAGLPHRMATRSFVEGAAWLAQIGLFVMLGLLVDPAQLGQALGPGLVLGLVLLLMARPVSVLVSATPFRLPWREQVFLSWAGLRGAVPIVLATVPLVTGARQAGLIFETVFVLVVVLTAIQGPAMPWLARRLGIAEDETTRDLEVDALPLERIGAEVLYLTVPPGSQLHGVEVFELRLPAGAVVSLIVRQGHTLVPDARTRIEHGDEVLLVSTAAQRTEVERRLRAVSRAGRLAGWFGEHGNAAVSRRTRRGVNIVSMSWWRSSGRRQGGTE